MRGNPPIHSGGTGRDDRSGLSYVKNQGTRQWPFDWFCLQAARGITQWRIRSALTAERDSWWYACYMSLNSSCHVSGRLVLPLHLNKNPESSWDWVAAWGTPTQSNATLMNRGWVCMLPVAPFGVWELMETCAKLFDLHDHYPCSSVYRTRQPGRVFKLLAFNGESMSEFASTLGDERD
ncbi:hypothetical protein BDV26DRAFT_55163 [Aspergillus bertholletiae]|uniref:Uncharacterized protein n=1 Tax=Aspergillus bertholletiae TaxID=1226010 RepID=A0A5N7AYH4_9EURO|nr:hypothetical protein BDV26DRAFT_55163 [Aspergillus bertholletiae]